MNKLVPVFYSLVIIVLLSRCANEFEIGDQFEYKRSLVVDGKFTNEFKEHRIILSYSEPVSEDGFAPIVNAQVRIEDDLGQSVYLEERELGVYYTPPMAGVVGRSYKLVLSRGPDDQYESEFQELKASPEILSINQQFSQIPVSDTNEFLSGLLMSIETAENSNGNGYYRYEWHDTHKISVPYPSRFTGSTSYRIVEPRTEDLEHCYRSASSSNIILGNTLSSSENRMVDFPLVLKDAGDIDYTIRYSIEVVQYSLGKSAYGYYNKLRQLNESNGTLFDRQQGEVAGNVKSANDENEVVLGYFEVSGVVKKRVFFNRDEFDPQLNAYLSGFTGLCPATDFYINTLDLVSFYEAIGVAPELRTFEKQKRAKYRVYDYFEQPMSNGVTYLRFAQCTDCRYFGTLNRPDYWVD